MVDIKSKWNQITYNKKQANKGLACKETILLINKKLFKALLQFIFIFIIKYIMLYQLEDKSKNFLFPPKVNPWKCK